MKYIVIYYRNQNMPTEIEIGEWDEFTLNQDALILLRRDTPRDRGYVSDTISFDKIKRIEFRE